ncbi:MULTISPECIES: S41 family peptidase [unclassified Meiothermus]|uniref:S41 family peptidase n=1 Tax=unclassified Meiothermus TaxID=370471 RepID=UPI000D7D1F4C|nr:MULTISPECIES: S41 family peptidase [unclassified Meiothermus]PZA06701.1 peptidase S41 [Meiothermus sp. Pnk-1]RYM36627.1 PDZ domain-containing protein [Meiothermus sp. PNK-Is4]
MLKRAALRAMALALALASVWAWASPAQELLNRAADLLAHNYAGPSTKDPTALAQKYLGKLNEACAPQGETCAVEVALPLLREMMSELGDPHSRLWLPEEYAGLGLVPGDRQARRGLGIRHTVVPELVGLIVLEVEDGSPAKAAGLRRGDRIVRVNGQELSGSADERRAVLAKAVADGGEIDLAVARAPFGALISLRITPGILATPLPEMYWLEEGIAWLRIPNFRAERTAQEVHRLVREAQDKGAWGLVLDLRNNGGGSLFQVILTAGAFVEEPGRRYERRDLLADTVVYRGGTLLRRDGGGERPLLSLPAPARWRGPMVVLVNKASASGAEFCALDLQSAGIPVIGEETAGVGDTVTNFFLLRQGGPALQITTFIARRLDGGAYPSRVTPDKAVADDAKALAEGHDVPLEAALGFLRSHRQATGLAAPDALLRAW